MSTPILPLMNDTARSYQTPDPRLDPATTSGMDDLFVDSVEVGTTRDDLVVPTDGIPVEQAATQLGLSVKTVKDRLRKGTLKGYKERGKFGERWMVCLGRDYLVVLSSPEESTRDTDVVVPTGMTLEPLTELLKQKDKELQAAHWRNGYLEAILSERDAQLKLLPDYQSKAAEADQLLERIQQLETALAAQETHGTWAKICSWFKPSS